MSNTNSIYGDNTISGYNYSISTNSSSNSMSMQDFLMLIVAQLQNQDMYSSSDSNGEFMSQMAQVASMQAMQELTASFMSSMAVNYMGKYVYAEAVTNTLERVSKEGIVERVNFNGGDVMVLVDDVWFKVSDIYEIKNTATTSVSNTESTENGNENEEGDTEKDIPEETPSTNAAATQSPYYNYSENSTDTSVPPVSGEGDDTDVTPIDPDSGDNGIDPLDPDADIAPDLETDETDPLAPNITPENPIEDLEDADPDSEVDPTLGAEL